MGSPYTKYTGDATITTEPISDPKQPCPQYMSDETRKCLEADDSVLAPVLKRWKGEPEQRYQLLGFSLPPCQISPNTCMQMRMEDRALYFGQIRMVLRTSVTSLSGIPDLPAH